MRLPVAPSLAVAALFAVGCGTPEDPQLAMCQAVAKQLTGNTITSWEGDEQSDGGRARNVRIAYLTTDEASGSIDCRFPIDRKDGAVATAPDAVTLNGRQVPTKELLSAGTKASGELLAGTAAETVARTREFAGEAGEKARDVADQALELTSEGAKALQEKLDR